MWRFHVKIQLCQKHSYKKSLILYQIFPPGEVIASSGCCCVVMPGLLVFSNNLNPMLPYKKYIKTTEQNPRMLNGLFSSFFVVAISLFKLVIQINRCYLSPTFTSFVGFNAYDNFWSHLSPYHLYLQTFSLPIPFLSSNKSPFACIATFLDSTDQEEQVIFGSISG